MDSIEMIVKKNIQEVFNKHDKYNRVELVDDPNVRSGKDWAIHGGNFPIKRNGNVYYVSRSMAVSLYCYCKNKNGEWCILASKRGPKASSAHGLWNVVNGYLDYSKTAEQQAALEAYQECGVKVPIDKIMEMGMNTRPSGRTQDFSVRFAAILDGTTDQYPTTIANCEPGECTDARWIPLSRVTHYPFAFGQAQKSIAQAHTILGDFTKEPSEEVNYLLNELYASISGNYRAKFLLDKIVKKAGLGRYMQFNQETNTETQDTIPNNNPEA